MALADSNLQMQTKGYTAAHMCQRKISTLTRFPDCSSRRVRQPKDSKATYQVNFSDHPRATPRPQSSRWRSRTSPWRKKKKQFTTGEKKRSKKRWRERRKRKREEEEIMKMLATWIRLQFGKADQAGEGARLCRARVQQRWKVAPAARKEKKIMSSNETWSER